MLTKANQFDALRRLGKAIADPTRSRILLALLAAPGYPAELARNLGIGRTNVSNHLACLRGCGLVAATPEGRRTRYEIADPHLAAALGQLLEVTLAIDADGCAYDGAEDAGAAEGAAEVSES
jgi:DNA-binding transcriptional ArsR family regulator